MEKDELHSALLYLMQKVAEIKENQMQDKHFVTAVTTVLRHFRDNGELKKAYESQKDSFIDYTKGNWAKWRMVINLFSYLQDSSILMLVKFQPMTMVIFTLAGN